MANAKQSPVSPTVKLELHETRAKGKNAKPEFSYLVTAAKNTTSPRIGSTLTEKEVDASIAKNQHVHHNIVMG